MVVDAAFEEVAPRVGRDVDLAERLARERERVAQVVARVEPELRHVASRSRSAGRARSPGAARASTRASRDRVSRRESSASQAPPCGSTLESSSAERVIAYSPRRLVESSRSMRRSLPYRLEVWPTVPSWISEVPSSTSSSKQLHGRAAAAVDLLVGVVVGLVLDHDVHRVEALAGARDRPLEEDRARRVVDVVVDPAHLALGRDHLLAVEAIADLDRDRLAVQHDARGARAGTGPTCRRRGSRPARRPGWCRCRTRSALT